MFWEKVKKSFSKFWYILWKDNSLKGWIISLVVIFVFIKFIFFPVLSLATGTSLPLAIVESCSMYHQGNIFSDFNSWWQRHETKYANLGINETQFTHFGFVNGFSKGDILFIVGANPNKLKIGDIIVFVSGTGNTPVIHRIINISDANGTKIFSTIGDSNPGQLVLGNNPTNVNEKNVTPNQIIGKAVFRIVPFLGWAKLVFFENQKPVDQRGFCSSQANVVANA